LFGGLVLCYNKPMDLKRKLSAVPESPGVYLMLDDEKNIIYVGKAKNLKKRLSQYFSKSRTHDEKVSRMMERVADFKYIITASEIDALLTENNLIKKHLPRYNILLRDDKNYPFLRIDLRQKFPAITLVRKLKPDGAKYFGPYMLTVNIKEILDLIHTAFKVRECTKPLDKGARRPCLNYHLGRCLAPCAGYASEEEYRAEITKVISFLRGNNREVENILTQKMREFSAAGNYEAAIICRDKLALLDKLVRKQVSAIPNGSNIDIFSSSCDGLTTVVNWTAVRGGKTVGGDNFVCDAADEDLSSFLFQFYKINPPLCDEVVVAKLPDAQTFENWLTELAGRKINVVSPKQGVRAQLLAVSEANAADYLTKLGTEEERRYRRTEGAVLQLAELLNLPTLPKRIEAYDISHISGTDKVASMVVFINGERTRAHYRKFKIKTVEGIDDFACMEEVIRRRLGRLDDADESFSSVPDLILIDGGAGQLAFAKRALTDAGRDIAVISLAKREEEVYLDKKPVTLPKDSLALSLLMRVRDEAHRFAVTYHKNLRNKHMTESALSEIEGVGKTRIENLFNHFKSFEKIKNADISELSKVKGISKNIAQNIYDSFHPKTE
jgi:excinuclease ABC subunit C